MLTALKKKILLCHRRLTKGAAADVAVIHAAVFAFCNVKTPKGRLSERASERSRRAATKLGLTDGRTDGKKTVGERER